MSIKPIKVAIQGVNDYGAEFDRFSSAVKTKIEAPLARVQSRMSAISRRGGFDQIGRSFSNLGAASSRLFRDLRQVGLWTGVAAGGAALMVKQVSDRGDNLIKTSRRLGLSVAALQEFRFAADRGNVSAKVFDASMERFSRGIAEAANNTGQARHALKFLGIDLRDRTTGKLRDTESVFLDVADALDRVKNQSVKNRALYDIFGRSGIRLNEIFRGGRTELSRLREEARRYGLVTESGAASSEKFNDRLTDLNYAFQGLQNEIGNSVIPALIPQIQRLTEKTIELRPEIQALARDFVERLPGRLKAIGEAGQGIKDAFGPLAGYIGKVVKEIGPANAVMITFAGIAAAKMIPAIAGITKAVAYMVPLLGTAAGSMAALGLGFAAAAGVTGAHFYNRQKELDQARAHRRNFGYGKLSMTPVTGTESASRLLGLYREQIEKYGTVKTWTPEMVGLENEMTKRGVAFTGSIQDRIDKVSAVAGGGLSIPGASAKTVGGKITVEFKNAPKGTSVNAISSGPIDIETSMGYTLSVLQ